MKEWAISRGATHYTHWFQPLTGATAEKHDSFITPTSDGRVIEKFDGSLLVQQEPDASSFPMAAFATRLRRVVTPSGIHFAGVCLGKHLVHPHHFHQLHGICMDNKTPLLKALAKVDEVATSVCQYFDKNITKVVATLGWEQEYFLVDALHAARPTCSWPVVPCSALHPQKGSSSMTITSVAFLRAPRHI